MSIYREKKRKNFWKARRTKPEKPLKSFVGEIALCSYIQGRKGNKITFNRRCHLGTNFFDLSISFVAVKNSSFRTQDPLFTSVHQMQHTWRVLCMSSSTVYILWWVSWSCRLFDACWLPDWEWLIRTTMNVPRIVYNQGRIAHRNVCRQIRESPWQAIACECIWAASLPQKMPADNTTRWMVKQSSCSELKQLFQILVLAFWILSFFFICAVTNC